MCVHICLYGICICCMSMFIYMCICIHIHVYMYAYCIHMFIYISLCTYTEIDINKVSGNLRASQLGTLYVAKNNFELWSSYLYPPNAVIIDKCRDIHVH